MSVKNAVVIVVDRLGANHLGPYGNTWIETPAWNRLARDSFLFENALIDTPRLDRLYRSYWQGVHARRLDSLETGNCLSALLNRVGVVTSLVTDDRHVADHGLATSFSHRQLVQDAEEHCTAQDVRHTHLARIFAAAAEQSAPAEQPCLQWIHARGMSAAWDAPLEFRRQFVEVGDPPPPESCDVPSRLLAESYDPDELLGIVHAYAGQVSLLDLCLGAWLDDFVEGPWAENSMLIVTSSRGFPLGEHRIVGDVQSELYGETLHVPFFVRLPHGKGAMARSHEFVQPRDIFATLVDWFDLPPDSIPVSSHSLLPVVGGEQQAIRDRACASHHAERAVRTPAWFMRVCKQSEPTSMSASATESGIEEPSAPLSNSPQEEGTKCELFVKPDDRWEVNDVSDRCPQIVDQLLNVLDNCQRAAKTGTNDNEHPLADVLVEGLG